MPGNLYPLAGSIIQYLVKRYGWRKMILFLRKLKKSAENQDKISLDIFKKSLEEIQKNWLKWIKHF